MIFKPSNVLLASFFASNFLYENKSRQQREFVSVRVFLPLKKHESFRIICNILVIYLLGCWGRQQTQNPKRFKFNSEAASVFQSTGYLTCIFCNANSNSIFTNTKQNPQQKRSASPAFDLQSSMTVLPVSMVVTIGIGVSIRVRHPVLSSFSHSVVGPHVLRNSSHRKI